MTAWIKPHWNLPPLDGEAPISPTAWRHHPSRSWIDLEEDNLVVMAQLICALTRPANPDLTLRHLQAFSNGELIRKWGQAHERFRDAPRKKRAEIERPFLRAEDLLRRSLLAGKALQVAWERARFPREFGSILAQVGAEVFDLGREHSMASQATDRLPPSSDVRKKLWSDFIPVVHIAMATREVLAASGVDLGEWDGIPSAVSHQLGRGDLMYSILFIRNNANLAPTIAERAEAISYQIQHQRLIPRPERLISLRRYSKLDGEKFPALVG